MIQSFALGSLRFRAWGSTDIRFDADSNAW